MTRLSLTTTCWLDQLSVPGDLAPDFDSLWSLHPKEFAIVVMMGRTVRTPRWQQSFIRDYAFSGANHDAGELPEVVKPLLDWANSLGYGEFNQCMINWYANGLHNIGAHRDNEGPLVPDSPVFSISLGQTRTLRVKCYSSKVKLLDLEMEDQTAVVMGGRFQKELTHEVPRHTGKKGSSMGPRINITFRQFK